MQRRLTRLLQSVLGVGAALGAGALATSGQAATQGQTYREPNAAPFAWQQFAQRVQDRFGEWLAAENDAAYRLHVFLEDRAARNPASAQTLVVKVWVAPDGKVERVDFPSLADAQANEDLQTVLTGGNIGQPPPAGMLQPLHLRLALKWKS
jgi:O-acetylhomoserine/O-acetylserine sulfhydrylase-like pyridoxal-dependent enzyme